MKILLCMSQTGVITITYNRPKDNARFLMTIDLDFL